MLDGIMELLKEHEGLELKPYRCTAGRLTIGFGRNLTENGISEKEAEMLLLSDIDRCFNEAKQFPWFAKLNKERKMVIISMLYNLGLSRFLTFKRMMAAIERNDYARAASEMLNSKWASQVKKRAVELAVIMKTGSMK